MKKELKPDFILPISITSLLKSLKILLILSICEVFYLYLKVIMS
jgi:hypothetical protein